MSFRRIEPANELKHLVECYWTVQDENLTTIEQKIIPDGFPEIIFHYGDPYEIKLVDRWDRQPMALLAGQLSNYFFLRNTGRSVILGIKFKPAGITQLFNLSMDSITDNVIELPAALQRKLNFSVDSLSVGMNTQGLAVVDEQLTNLIPKALPETVEKAIGRIRDTRGVLSVNKLCSMLQISERQLERHFKKYIGLSPKFYTRIVRFSYIFEVLQNKKMSWSQLGLECGFYDQSHFIKNFREFTGEDPSDYLFDEPNLANFFLKK
jgi:AraC-like DNA-binding protein